MVKKSILVFSLFFFFSLAGCTGENIEKPEVVFSSQPEVAEIRAEKPVKIKLKKNVSGSYSWEISGNDADRIIDTDKKLRVTLGK